MECQHPLCCIIVFFGCVIDLSASSAPVSPVYAHKNNSKNQPLSERQQRPQLSPLTTKNGNKRITKKSSLPPHKLPPIKPKGLTVIKQYKEECLLLQREKDLIVKIDQLNLSMKKELEEYSTNGHKDITLTSLQHNNASWLNACEELALVRECLGNQHSPSEKKA